MQELLSVLNALLILLQLFRVHHRGQLAAINLLREAAMQIHKPWCLETQQGKQIVNSQEYHEDFTYIWKL